MSLRNLMVRCPVAAMAVVLAGLVALTALAPTPADASQFKRIHDVNVSCTNALRCNLYISNPRVTLFAVGFRRDAAFEAPLALYLTLREPLIAGSEVRFVIDGVDMLTVPASAFSYRAAISEYVHREQAQVNALFAAAKQGERLQVVYGTRTGQSTAPFSLSGIIAGATFMDEVQGRVGRADSLVALGAAPAETADTTQPDDMADLDVVPAGLRPYYVGEGAPCADFDGSVPESFDGFEADLGDGMALIGLRCGAGGAYNFPFAFWERGPEGYRQLALPAMSDAGPMADLVAWNATWDPDSRQLEALFKGRGLGDCGAYSRWSLAEGGSGLGFVLQEMRVKDECDGVFDDALSDWDQAWPLPADKS